MGGAAIGPPCAGGHAYEYTQLVATQYGYARNGVVTLLVAPLYSKPPSGEGGICGARGGGGGAGDNDYCNFGAGCRDPQAASPPLRGL